MIRLHTQRRWRLWPSGIWTILGAIVVHLPGFAWQVRFDEGMLFSKVKYLVGGISDGLFFLLGIHILSRQRKRKKFAYLIMVVAVLIFLLINIGDEIWQEASHGETAEMWVVVAGIKNARDQMNAQKQSDSGGFQNRVFKHILVIVLGLMIHFSGCRYYYSTTNKNLATSTHLCLSGVLAIALHNFGCWLPLFQTFQALALSFVLSPPGGHIQVVNPIKNTNLQGQPNVIYVIAESMSGVYSLDTHKGRAAMPFFQSLVKNDTQLHVFPNVRSVSGDTTDCMTALITGCTPYTKRGEEIALSRSIGSEFKKSGYQTISVTSRRLDMLKTKWQMIQNYLTANMDTVFDPLSEGYEATNEEGSDDHILFPHFEQWMKEEKNESIPFYAQLYLFNTHWPYVCKNCTIPDDRIFESFKSVDEYIKKLFGLLEETGHLKDTIIVFSGDHGEYKKKYYRLSDISSQILKPLTAIYAPIAVLPPDAATFLKRNKDRLVSTLDLYPTIWNILHNGDEDREANSNSIENVSRDKSDCITGLNLMGTTIPTDRVVISYNYVSKKGSFLALSNLTSSIFKQKNNLMSIRYNNCTIDWNSGPCKFPLTQDDKNYWLKYLFSENVTLLQDNITHIQHPFMASEAIITMKEILRKYKPARNGTNSGQSRIPDKSFIFLLILFVCCIRRLITPNPFIKHKGNYQFRRD